MFFVEDYFKQCRQFIIINVMHFIVLKCHKNGEHPDIIGITGDFEIKAGALILCHFLLLHC